MNAQAQPNPRGLTFADLLAAIRRRRWPMILAIAVVLPIAVAATLLWPATYRSTATILIEQQEIPTDLVRSTISSFAAQRLQVINQRVMTTANLLQIIDKYDLYAEERKSEPREVIIGQMRDAVHLNMISADVVDPRAGTAVKATIAFTLSFDSSSPSTAARVANELTTLYLNENIQARKASTANTANFLGEEAERISRTIADQEMKLVAFKEQNADNLPQLAQVNATLMSRAEDEMRQADAKIFSLDQQLVYLDAQLAQAEPIAQILGSTGQRIISPTDRLKALRSEYIRATAMYAPDHPDVQRLKREMDGLQKEVGNQQSGAELARQLADAQSQLVAARQRYGADHPDITRLERLVASAEEAMRAAPVTAEAMAVTPDNPAYIQLTAQREMTVNEKASLQQQKAQIAERITGFERRLAQAPEVERSFNAMARELEASQQKYREVRQKQMEAQVALNLESESRGERFTLIEPPLPAEQPFTPNRPAIFVLGVVLSLVVAAGLAVLLEALDTSIRGERDLEQLLTAGPLAVVPWMLTDEDHARARRNRRYALAGAIGSVVLAVGAVHTLYRPLDILWMLAWRRFVG